MKTALIGLGRIGWEFHLAALLKHEEYQLCAVVDPSEERRAEAFQLCGVRGYADYKDMLQAETPELVVIASPTIFHEEQAIAAMEAGVNVLLDKPMAKDLDEAKRIVAAMHRTGRKLVVYQPHRFYPEAVAAQELIASGVLGTVYGLTRTCCNYVRRNDWQAFKEFGGGMLNNYGAHFIDQLIYLSGDSVKNVFCHMRKIASLGDTEDVVRIAMQTETGMLLDIDINQATAFSPIEMTIYGTTGTAILTTDSDGKPCWQVRYFKPEDLDAKEVVKEMAAVGRRYPSDNIPWIEKILPISDYTGKDFYAMCDLFYRGEGPSPVPVEETINVMTIMAQCRTLAEKQ